MEEITAKRTTEPAPPCGAKAAAPVGVGLARRGLGFAVRAVVVFLVTTGLLFGLLWWACSQPTTAAERQNLSRSAELISREGLYPEYFGIKLFQMDNYTDTVMLFEAATTSAAAGQNSPSAALAAMMANTAYNVDNFSTLADDLQTYLSLLPDSTALTAADVQTLEQQVQQAGLKPFSYARYWHGYLIWLRPLLHATDYAGVRLVNALVLAGLALALLWQLRQRCGARAAIWFGISQVLVTVWWVPRQMQFYTCFLVAYLGCVWVLARPHPMSAQTLALGLLSLGACTAFLDLLVTPIITLGLPVTVWLLRRDTNASVPQKLEAVAGASISWGAGYGVCWAAKWWIASAVTGRDVVNDAVHQIGVRTTADVWHGMELTWGNILHFVWQTLNEHGAFWPALVLLVLLIGTFLLCQKGRKALWQALPLLLCAAMAPAWFVLLRTHSIQHGWFTWRALGVTWFAGIAFLHNSCSLKTGLQRLQHACRRQGSAKKSE